MVIDGKKIAQKIILELKQQKTPNKRLVAILVGDDSSSISFLKQKEKIAKELGIDFSLIRLPETIGEEKLCESIDQLSNDNSIGGIILQLPLPSHISTDNAIQHISPNKKTVTSRRT